MSPMPPVNAGKMPLGLVLHRANMRLALLTLTMAGTSIFVVGLIALRVYMIDNLVLSAHGVAYGVEAAVVFNDREAIDESIAKMVAKRPISSVRIFDRDGNELAHWRRPEDDIWWPAKAERLLAGMLFPAPATAQVEHDGRAIGTVKLYGSSEGMLVYLLIGIGCGVFCLLPSGLIASRFSRQASKEIVEPLQHLAAVAAKARRERQFGHRAAPMAIAELDDLRDDFNALLEELARWQAQMVSHNESLTRQANHDPPTELANRAHFDARLTAELADPGGGARVALFFIDTDRFKAINDELGHEAGDAVLATIARRLRSQVREGDLVARIGGDEFAALLTPLGDASQASSIAAGMLDAMKEPVVLPAGKLLTVSFSIGIAFYPDHARDSAGLMKKADEAMYRSKRAGRGTYSVASIAAPPEES